MNDVLVTLAALLYVAAAILALREIGEPVASTRRTSVALVLGLVAALLHLGHHALVMRTLGGPDLHFFAAMSTVGALVAAGTSLIGLWRPVTAVGAVVFPLALAALLGDALGGHRPVTASAEPWQIQTHALLALLAYATLSIAAVVAILLALQDLALRRHRVEWFRYLPPLSLIEDLLFQLIGVGFALLSLALVTGGLFVEDLFAQHLAHKTVFSIASWLVFGALLFGRWRWGWRGQRAARLTLAGMALLVLGFLGSKFVLEIVLGRV